MYFRDLRTHCEGVHPYINKNRIVSVLDLLFYIIYVPSKFYRRSRKRNAINALCYAACVYSIAVTNYFGSLVRTEDPGIKIVVMALLFAIDIIGCIWLSFRLDKRYTYAKVVEVEEKYKPIVSPALAKAIYWLSVLLGLLLLLSIPFVLLNVRVA
jgi:hypothetical protein